jgi:isopentenyl-diphosphate delta-isomerase
VGEIGGRKNEHIDIVLRRDVSAHAVTTGLEAIRFEHCALPEIALADVDLSTNFLGRRVKAPVLVSSMTGGTSRTATVNASIARACATLGLAFAVGSQRVALEAGGVVGFSRELRRVAPDVPILANFGAAQLKSWDGPDMARRAVEMIGADALIVHLNPLQEVVQHGGDTDWSGLLAAIGRIARAVPFPVVVKEVGAGISGATARRLVDAGVAVIDVAGAGGTSWAAVEAERAPTAELRALGTAFRDWGIPTAVAVRDVRRLCPTTPIVASGGLRDGIDCAKALRIGADMTGFAAGVLPAALDGADALTARLETLVAQLRIACFCTGSRDVAALKTAPLVGGGP